MSFAKQLHSHTPWRAVRGLSMCATCRFRHMAHSDMPWRAVRGRSLCSCLAKRHRRRNMRVPAAGCCGELRPQGALLAPCHGEAGFPNRSGNDAQIGNDGRLNAKDKMNYSISRSWSSWTVSTTAKGWKASSSARSRKPQVTPMVRTPAFRPVSISTLESPT